MQIFIVIFFLIFTSEKIYAQNDDCNSKLTEAEIIKIAKKKHAYRDKIKEPSIYFSPQRCVWEIQSMVNRKEVTKHNMKHVKLTFLTLVIDAETKKVKSREKDVHYVPYNEP